MPGKDILTVQAELFSLTLLRLLGFMVLKVRRVKLLRIHV